jgi:hypothetical protein
MRTQKHLLLSGIGLLLLMAVGCADRSSAVAEDDASKKAVITEAEVNAAQQAWCDGLVRIGKVYKDGGDYKAAASQFIDDTYDFK